MVIPARYASRRFPAKALALLWGRPLIEQVWRRAIQVRGVNGVLVATDNERIKEAVEAFGGRVVMTSPTCRTGTDRVAEAVKDSDCDLVINLQGDEPLIDPRAVERLIDCMKQDETLVMATLACPVTDQTEIADPNVVKVVTDIRGYALYFSRSAIPFRAGEGLEVLRHLGIYAFRRDFLLQFCRLPQTPLELAEALEQLRALEHGFRIKVLLTDHHSPGIDTPEQLAKLNSRQPPVE